MSTSPTLQRSTPSVRVAIVGAGFGGIGLAIRLRQSGIEDFVVLERAQELGGTWRDNTYPGCACDVQSHLYSLSFAPNAKWTRKFAGQDEIWRYLRAVAREFGVLSNVSAGQCVLGAKWDEANRRWEIRTTSELLHASVLVLAGGPLSEPAIPSIPGLDGFGGPVFHSARWRHDVDLSGKRVAIVGTGASAIQIVPQIQPIVASLHLYQRTPPWVMPRRDRAIPAWRRTLYANVPAARTALRVSLYLGRELMGLPFRHPWMASLVEGVARRHMEGAIADPTLRAKLTPSYRIGCKRILVSDDYYPALAQANVEVLTTAVTSVEDGAIVDAEGGRRTVDAVVLATGFRATDPPLAPHVVGSGGRSLAEAWRGSPRAYLGTSVAGFPNLFLLLGPNTGLGHTSVLLMIEAQIEHILGVVALMDSRGAYAVEPRREAEDAFVGEMQRRLSRTIWNTGGCHSWYLDRNGVNSTLWPAGTWSFRRRLRRVIESDYHLSRRA